MPKKLKQYRVRLEYHTTLTETVEAKTEEEAVKLAEEGVDSNRIGLESIAYSADAEEL